MSKSHKIKPKLTTVERANRNAKIMRLRRKGVSFREIGKHFDLAQSTVKVICDTERRGGDKRAEKDKNPTHIRLPVGQARKYETPQDLLDRINDYLELCHTNDKVGNDAHLALYLGFSTVDGMRSYAEKDGYSDIIQGIGTYFEGDRNERLFVTTQYQGAKFELRAKRGWHEKQTPDRVAPANINIHFGDKVIESHGLTPIPHKDV